MGRREKRSSIASLPFRQHSALHHRWSDSQQTTSCALSLAQPQLCPQLNLNLGDMMVAGEDGPPIPDVCSICHRGMPVPRKHPSLRGLRCDYDCYLVRDQRVLRVSASTAHDPTAHDSTAHDSTAHDSTAHDSTHNSTHDPTYTPIANAHDSIHDSTYDSAQVSTSHAPAHALTHVSTGRDSASMQTSSRRILRICAIAVIKIIRGICVCAIAVIEIIRVICDELFERLAG